MNIKIRKPLGDGRELHIDTQIPQGEIFAIVGASGVGKTTFLNILAGLSACVGELDGVPKKVGYVFQENRLLPHLTALENLQYTGADEQEAIQYLQTVGMQAQANIRCEKLSGGEKRRVALGRAFLSGAELLLLDEPFTALDTANKIELCRLLIQLWEKQKPTVVLVTHDIEEAFMLGHSVASLVSGEIAKLVRIDEPFGYGRGNEQKGEILKSLGVNNGR